MNIDDFRYIITVADTLNMTKAAHELFISQPALSQRIKYIESFYRVSIFQRSKHGMQLTPEGKLFIKYAKIITETEQALRTAIPSTSPDQSVLHLGILQSFNAGFLPALLKKMQNYDENLHFEITEETSVPLMNLLLKKKIDAAICYLPVISDELEYEVIYHDRFVLIPAANGSLEKSLSDQGIPSGSSIDSSFLKNEAFAVGEPGARSNLFLNQINADYNLHIRIRHHCKNFSSLRKIAMSGIASAFVSKSFLSMQHKNTPFFYVNVGRADKLNIALTWRSDSYLSDPCAALIRYAQELSEQKNSLFFSIED